MRRIHRILGPALPLAALVGNQMQTAVSLPDLRDIKAETLRLVQLTEELHEAVDRTAGRVAALEGLLSQEERAVSGPAVDADELRRARLALESMGARLARGCPQARRHRGDAGPHRGRPEHPGPWSGDAPRRTCPPRAGGRGPAGGRRGPDRTAGIPAPGYRHAPRAPGRGTGGLSARDGRDRHRHAAGAPAPTQRSLGLDAARGRAPRAGAAAAEPGRLALLAIALPLLGLTDYERRAQLATFIVRRSCLVRTGNPGSSSGATSARRPPSGNQPVPSALGRAATGANWVSATGAPGLSCTRRQ